ncbi:hypothetical protein LTR66_009908 [Elasticomyces elasticus]|nr:hypothetical protein LTR66_009908 [Elasticomyces elasticus]
MALPQLDHLILLLPYHLIKNPPPWLTSSFIISPGGRHADGKTENKLIIFRDGTYIELIAFIDDLQEHREGHWWGDKKPGFIDFALTSLGEHTYSHDAINRRLAVLEGNGLRGVKYTAPVKGGRKNENGQDIEWLVTFPEGAKRGEVPFWYHDVTARTLRVPCDNAAYITHPCGAIGVSQVTILVPESKFASFAAAYSGITAQQALPGDGTTQFAIAAPEHVAGTEALKLCARKTAHVREEVLDGERGGAIAEILIRTAISGQGHSRDYIEEKVDGEVICIRFVHSGQ